MAGWRRAAARLTPCRCFVVSRVSTGGKRSRAVDRGEHARIADSGAPKIVLGSPCLNSQNFQFGAVYSLIAPGSGTRGSSVSQGPGSTDAHSSLRLALAVAGVPAAELAETSAQVLVLEGANNPAWFRRSVSEQAAATPRPGRAAH